MASSTLPFTRIAGVSAAVPDRIRTTEDDCSLWPAEEVAKVVASTGVRKRHISQHLTTADLCQAAAEQLIHDTGCSADEIDALIFISQTPDYLLPATACCLQERLGLSQGCAALDVSLGCSGYVYGLWLASNLIAAGGARKALLLVGDTSYRLCSPEDRSVSLLFGDAGTATLLERDPQTGPAHFVLGTDGRGEPHLCVPMGGCRNPRTIEDTTRKDCESGNRRAPVDLFMNGAEIFAFTLSAVPSLVNQVFHNAALNSSDVDFFVFHQANKFMLDHLFKRLKLPPEKCVLGLQQYGNTSSASIPLAMVTELRGRLTSVPTKLVLAGFGVGFSWAGASVQCGPMVVPELVIVPDIPRHTPS